MENLCKILVENPEDKRLLERPKSRRQESITIDIKKVGLSVWIGFN
jgi:hypothetical protein